MTPFDVAEAAARLHQRIGVVPTVSVVLGSGLGAIEAELTDPIVVPFAELPGYPATSVTGHAGRYVVGRLGGGDVLLQCGRFHYYEGHPSEVVALPVRVAAALGVRAMLFTNAAGAIREDLGTGDLVLLSDHINFMFRSPLIGGVLPGETRFPDMSEAYDRAFRGLALDVARESGLDLRQGVYAAMLGPAYETPSEVRMLARLGADVVGMSTVPEVLVARGLGQRCLGLSVVTNKAAGMGGGPLSHQEVMEGGKTAGARVTQLLARLVPRIAEELQSVGTK